MCDILIHPNLADLVIYTLRVHKQVRHSKALYDIHFKKGASKSSSLP